MYRAADRTAAKAALDEWYGLVERFDIADLSTFAPTIGQWENQFFNYFDSRATNARSEARNLIIIIKQVKRLLGFGFKRFDHYRLRVLYRCWRKTRAIATVMGVLARSSHESRFRATCSGVWRCRFIVVSPFMPRSWASDFYGGPLSRGPVTVPRPRPVDTSRFR